MKELCIQVCTRVRLMIEVTEEMERDFYDCWNKAEHTKEFKDCDSCSWHGQNVTEGTSACEIVAEQVAGKGGSYGAINRKRRMRELESERTPMEGFV